MSQNSVDPDTTKEEIAVAPDRLSDAFSVYQKELNKQKTNDKKDLNKKKTNGIKYLNKQKARYYIHLIFFKDESFHVSFQVKFGYMGCCDFSINNPQNVCLDT